MKPVLLGPKEQIAAEQFRGFYARLTEIRDTILLTGPAIVIAADAPDVGHTPVVPRRLSVEEVRATLRDAIIDYGYRPEDSADALLDAGYVMAAVADEVLLLHCAAWPGYAEWIDRPLESVLYGTSLAGDRVFEAARALLAQTREDPRTAIIILLALLTGFRGRYYARKDEPIIEELERDLYQLVCSRPYAADDPAPYAAPNLTATTLIGQSTRPLPVLWPWVVAILLVALAYLPLSHLIWWSEASKIDAVADRIAEKHHLRENVRTTEIRP